MKTLNFVNGTMQNVVGPTLVAMATKFGLGAEIQSPTGLLCYGCYIGVQYTKLVLASDEQVSCPHLHLWEIIVDGLDV